MWCFRFGECLRVAFLCPRFILKFNFLVTEKWLWLMSSSLRPRYIFCFLKVEVAAHTCSDMISSPYRYSISAKFYSSSLSVAACVPSIKVRNEPGLCLITDAWLLCLEAGPALMICWTSRGFRSDES